MKNLLLFLAFAFLVPVVASANNYVYGARQSEDDPCCIIITVGVTDEAYAGTLVVEIDGVPTYTDLDSEGIDKIEHCFEGDGSYDVDFYGGGVLLGTSYTFDITGCEGGCTDCNFTTLVPQIQQVNDCNFIVDYRWTTVTTPSGTTKGYSPDCVDPVVFWDFGDGTTSDTDPLTGGYFHDYPADGTYTACLTFTVTNSITGVDCSVRECIEVVVDGCDPDPDPCCGLDIGTLEYRVFGSGCLTWIQPIKSTVESECGDATYAYTVDGVSVPSFGQHLLVTFVGMGPFEVCLTITQGNCDVTQCIMVDLPNCQGFAGEPGDAVTRFGAVDLTDFTDVSVAPNPATDWINVSISENPFSDSERITIFDTNGKVIQTANAQANNITSMDVSELPMGIYFVQVSNELGMISTERFVKTK